MQLTRLYAPGEKIVLLNMATAVVYSVVEVIVMMPRTDPDTLDVTQTARDKNGLNYYLNANTGDVWMQEKPETAQDFKRSVSSTCRLDSLE